MLPPSCAAPWFHAHVHAPAEHISVTVYGVPAAHVSACPWLGHHTRVSKPIACNHRVPAADMQGRTVGAPRINRHRLTVCVSSQVRGEGCCSSRALAKAASPCVCPPRCRARGAAAAGALAKAASYHPHPALSAAISLLQPAVTSVHSLAMQKVVRLPLPSPFPVPSPKWSLCAPVCTRSTPGSARLGTLAQRQP